MFSRHGRGFFDPPKGARVPSIVQPAARPRAFERYVFICGLHRSGTTLLEALVHAACDVSVLRADVSENEGQHLQDVYPRALEWGGAGRFAFAPAMRASSAGPDAPALRERLLACWTPWVRGEARVLLEKSPPNLLRIGWLREVFPGARFIVVTRDPRAVAAATMKWSGTSFAELMYHWHVAHAAALEDMADDCLHISYEHICANADDVVSQVAEFAGLYLRAEPLPLPERFRNLENSNRRYFRAMPELNFGPGAWERFGYDLISG